MPLSRRTLVVVGSSLVLTACSDSPTEPGRGTAASILVGGAPGVLAVGDTAPLTARVVDAGGRTLASPTVTWRSLDTAVAHVDDRGRVAGWDAGSARIVAEAGAIADTVSLAVEVLPRRLDIAVTGWGYTDTSSTVIVGNSVSLRPILLDGRGRALSSNQTPVFTIDDSTVATAPSGSSTSPYSYSKVAGRATYRVRMAGIEGQTTVKFGLVAIALQGQGLSRLAMGTEHACGLAGDGTARCWGSNDVGQVGRATDPNFYYAPIGAVAGAPTFARIAARGRGSCGITVTQRLWCWGESALPSTTGGAQPILGGLAVADVAIGTAGQACALTTSREVWCWGKDAWPTVDSVPVKRAIDQPFTQVSVGAYGYGCGLLDTGRVACWSGVRGAAEPIGGAYGAFTRIEAAYNGGCGLTAAGQLWCWYGTAGSTATPWSTTERFTDFGAGSGFTCAFAAADGQIWCMGANPSYYSTGQYSRSVPTRIARDDHFTSMLMSDRGVCGVLANGDLRCQGFYAPTSGIQ